MINMQEKGLIKEKIARKMENVLYVRIKWKGEQHIKPEVEIIVNKQQNWFYMPK